MGAFFILSPWVSANIDLTESSLPFNHCNCSSNFMHWTDLLSDRHKSLKGPYQDFVTILMLYQNQNHLNGTCASYVTFFVRYIDCNHNSRLGFYQINSIKCFAQYFKLLSGDLDGSQKYMSLTCNW